MDWKDIPCYIINRDNLTRGFKQQVEWLRKIGIKNLTVVDNASTYPALLEYYRQAGFRLIKKDRNHGPWVFWDTKLYEEVQDVPYIVSDSDVAPDATCPEDLIEYMLWVQENHTSQQVLKIGPGLRIDNIPDTYQHKERVISHETQFSLDDHLANRASWVNEKSPRMFEAILDTTFSLYRPGEKDYSTGWCRHYRMDKPYVFNHLPWLEDSSVVNTEREYYHSHANLDWCHW